jgi:Fe-Mn family superoxide dismutase
MISLMSLPYAQHALEPHLSEKTIQFHYGKHHKGYVDTLNTLILGTPYETQNLEDIIRTSYKKDEKIFNNAAQIWNHDFYWSSLTPHPMLPKGTLLHALQRDFGSLEAFLEAFLALGLSQFGSGWCWLVKDVKGTLSVVKTSNADLPWIHGLTPLLTCDVWEHAYYLDYQNLRKDYMVALRTLFNWEFAEKNLAEEIL